MADALYNSLDTILGDEMFLYVEVAGTGENSGTTTWEPIAFTTTCSLSINGDSIDVSNKMDGVWSAAKMGKMGWTVSSSNLLAEKTETTTGFLTDFDYFYDKMVTRKPFKMRFGRITDIATRDFTLNTSKTYYEGSSYMTSCELNADNGSAISMSVELTGCGELKKVTA